MQLWTKIYLYDICMSMTLIQSITCSLTWFSRADLKSNLHWVTCHTFLKVDFFFPGAVFSGEVPTNAELRKKNAIHEVFWHLNKSLDLWWRVFFHCISLTMGYAFYRPNGLKLQTSIYHDTWGGSGRIRGMLSEEISVLLNKDPMLHNNSLEGFY